MRRIAIAVALLAATLAPLGPAQGSSCSSGPVNDCQQDALEWLANPVSFSNVGATMEPGEPTACDGTTVHRSVWLRLEVLSPGAADPFKVVFDAPFMATAGAYTETGDGALSVVSCQASWEDEGDRFSPVLFLPCTPGARYWLQVGGQSNADAGTFSLVETRYWKFNLTLSEPCPFKPSLPTEPRLSAPTPGDGQVALSWVEPSWDGGRSVAISHYNVYRGETCAGDFRLVGSPSARGFTDTGLPPGASYCYKVTAVNPVGEGPAEPGRAATTWDLPRAPRDLSVQPAGDGELALAWLPSPDEAGPAPMVAHRVYRAESASGPFVLVGSAGPGARSFTEAGLVRGATLHYRVSAVNVVGEGAQGDASSGTTWAIPDAPRDVQLRQPLGVPSFEVSWQPPAGGAPFTHYRVYRASSADGPATFVGEVASTTLRFTERAPGVLLDYHYEVRAWNPAGEGGASSRACGAYPVESPFARCS